MKTIFFFLFLMGVNLLGKPLDPAGTRQEVGGIGALLSMDATQADNSVKTYQYLNDAGGNIVKLLDADTNSVVNSYEYGPFRQVISKFEGVENSFQYNTKYLDSETGLLYYGYRFYDDQNGRWINRDPIGVNGGINLYNSVSNNMVNGYSGGLSISGGMENYVTTLKINMGIDSFGEFIELWYGNHIVQWPSSHRHSKLWIITDDAILIKKDKRFSNLVDWTKFKITDKGNECFYMMSIGAGPDGVELKGDFNRDRDISLNLENPILIKEFDSIDSFTKFIVRVNLLNLVLNSNFKTTTLEYEALLGDSYTAWNEWDEYNSNSYVSGILNVSGFVPPTLVGVSPRGYTKPIPSFIFKKLFKNDDVLKIEFKKYYPGF